MKVSELLLEYKNKYYKAITKKPKPRPKKTLWYNEYENWVADIKYRFPDSHANFDEENEEIVATDDAGEVCYGKWSKNKKGMKGVTFNNPRNPKHTSRNHKRLVRIKDPVITKKSDEDDLV